MNNRLNDDCVAEKNFSKNLLRTFIEKNLMELNFSACAGERAGKID